MVRPTKVEPLAAYRLHVSFPYGVSGVIDLSSDVGRGVFAPLADEAFFRTVHLGEFGQIAWSPEIEICGDAVYRELAEAQVAGAHA